MSEQSLYESIITYLDETQNIYQADPENKVIAAHITGDDGSWRAVIQIGESDEVRRVMIRGIFPAHVPELRRLQFAEYLTRINYSLEVGSFDMDMDDGEVSFRTTVNLADAPLTRAMFNELYEINGVVVNSYYGDILSVAFGGMEPLNALKERRPEGEVLQ